MADDDSIIELAAHQKKRRRKCDDPTTEDALALRFSAQHAEALRYVHLLGRWLQWDGRRWKFEDTLAVFDLARDVVRDVALACNTKSILDARTVAAIERLAKADRRHARTADIWDIDDRLLNTPSGVVDLANGSLLPHDRSLHMTKIAAAAPGGDCPLWRYFLRQITADNDDLAAFLQRVAGYCLTGLTTEHALFFCYGTGGNGKGVFLNTLMKILGDYAAVAPMETFMVSPNQRHPTDVAGLRGARCVTAQEVEAGQRWAESKIKALTGGDPISARFMRQDFFTFIPKFKLLIAGNHKPSLRSVDEAIRRRFFLIPFVVTIPPDQRDKDLSDKLVTEAGGILQWAIDGCLEWQRIGLAAPACVLDATLKYFDAQDVVTEWLADCCIVAPGARSDRRILFDSFAKWCERSGEDPGRRDALYEKLETSGFTIVTVRGTRFFDGVSLKTDDMSAAYWNR